MASDDRKHQRKWSQHEEIKLGVEDERILDNVWDEMAAEEQTRLVRYRPLMATLVECLRIIDDEAVPLADGTPTGLWWYARHVRRDGVIPKKFTNEVAWHLRLKEMLNDRKIPVTVNLTYPTPPLRYCDLVVQWPDLGEIWLEVKGAWRHEDSKGKRKNRSYHKHLHAAGEDLEKVCTLGSSSAKHVGLLVVGFDTTSKTITDDDLYKVESKAGRAGWVKQYESWPDRRLLGRVHVWLWMNAAECLPGGE